MTGSQDISWPDQCVMIADKVDRSRSTRSIVCRYRTIGTVLRSSCQKHRATAQLVSSARIDLGKLRNILNPCPENFCATCWRDQSMLDRRSRSVLSMALQWKCNSESTFCQIAQPPYVESTLRNSFVKHAKILGRTTPWSAGVDIGRAHLPPCRPFPHEP